MPMTATCKTPALLILLLALLCGCAASPYQTAVESATAPSSTRDVALLVHEPRRPYIAIAQLEMRGTRGMPIDALLEEMRKRARRLGADAVLPQERRQSTLGLDDNPWVGGYEKSPEGLVPVVYGYAIKFSGAL